MKNVLISDLKEYKRRTKTLKIIIEVFSLSLNIINLLFSNLVLFLDDFLF